MQEESSWLVQYGPLITALATFVASIIALFKESIIGLWKKAKITIELKEEKKFKEIIDRQDKEENETEGAKQAADILVAYYDLNMEIMNKGSEPCKNCEIYLEKIEYKENDNVPLKSLDIISGQNIKWCSKEKGNVDIPPYGGKVIVTLIRIISPEKKSSAKGKPATTPGLQIGDVLINQANIAGQYKILFRIYSINHKSKALQLEFRWNGNWKKRITEFMEIVTLGMEIKK